MHKGKGLITALPIRIGSMQLYIAIFDANGVLINPDPALNFISEKEYELFKENGLKLSKAQISKAWKSAVKVAKANPGPNALLEAHMEFFEILNIPQSLLKAYEEIDAESFKHYEPMEQGERDILRKIKRLGLYTTVLTDTIQNSASKKLMLANAGLAGIFDGIFVPNDTGHRKPEPEAYKAVLESFKAEPENAIFIGHEKDEIDGAKLLGIRTIAYKESIRSADYTANSFADIFHIIKGIKKGELSAASV